MNVRRTVVVLLLVCLSGTVPVSAAIHTWTGAASDRFSDAANWRGGSPAGDADAELAFPAGVAHILLANDLPALTVQSIIFSGSGYSIGGQAITLAAGAQVADSTDGPNILECDLLLQGAATFHVSGSDPSGGYLVVSGAIGGNGPVRKIGYGRTTFSGPRPNTYSGVTEVLDGELRLAKSDGVAAIAGNLVIDEAAGGGAHGRVVTLANEQIPDTASIHVGTGSTLGIGGFETVGPLELESSASVQTAVTFSGLVSSTGTLILSGDITGGPGFNGGQFWGDIALRGMRTVTAGQDSAIDLGALRDATPGAGLILHGAGSVGARDGSSYHGPTIVDGPSASISNLNTAVLLRSGTFGGTVASLVAEQGRVRGAITAGDLRLSGTTTCELRTSSGNSPTLAAGGTLDLGHARLAFTIDPNVSRVLGKVYVVGRNDGPDPIRGTFSGVPEGTILADRFRVSYVGGDGNDLTLTEIGRYRTILNLSAHPVPLDAGQTLTLSVQTGSEKSTGQALPGQVTFLDGGTVIGTAPIAPIGSATLTVQPSAGSHEYTATYAGDDERAPATSNRAFVNVYAPLPTVTTVDPAVADGGTTATFTVHGTGFLPTGQIIVASTVVPATYISATEMRFTWNVPSFEQDTPTTVYYQHPELAITRSSNSVPLLIKAAPLPASGITFEQTIINQTVTSRAVLGPVAPGGSAAWLAVIRASRLGNTTYVPNAVTPDTDGDGLVRWEQRTDEFVLGGIWVMVDMTDGRLLAAQANGRVPHADPLPQAMFVRDAAGLYSQVVVPPLAGVTELLWVRPGVGAWRISIGGGSPDVQSGISRGYRIFDVARMHAVTGSTAPVPAGFQPGDTIAGIDFQLQHWFGGRVTEEILHQSDGPGTVLFGSATQEIDIMQERAAVARLVVIRTGGSDGAVSVNYTTADGTAAAGVHYVPRAGTVTFGPGEIVKTIDIPLIDDSVYSGTTTFSVVLSNPAGTTITGDPKLTMSINDDDLPPQLSVTGSTVTEGDHGVREATAVVTVTGAFRLPVIAKWSYRLGSGSGIPGPTLTFQPGGPASQTIVIPYDANETPEDDRVYQINISPVNARPEHLTGQVTVLDEDPVELTVLDTTVSETQTTVFLLVTASRGSWKPVSVHYETASGTATAGSDFTATSGTLTLSTNRNVQRVHIPLLPDTAAEGDEFFTLLLSGAVNATIRRASATVTILDDETPALPGLSGAPVTVVEGIDPAAQFGFRLSFPSLTEVRFRVTTVAGSATATTDFQPKDQVLTIPAGATFASFSVPIPDNKHEEGNETFSLLLSEPVGALIGTPIVPATIVDDASALPDSSLPGVSVADLQLPEGSGSSTTARFTVVLSRPATATITLPYGTADGTATTPADYTPSAGTLTFTPGETSKSIDVAITADYASEPNETFTLVLGIPTNAILIRPVATCRIVNDDQASDRRRTVGH
jgi:autotransporter-associated beta strand protein